MTTRVWPVLLIAVVVGVAVLGIAFAPAVAQEKDKEKARMTWEYKVVKGEINDKTLNGLGDQGWELVQFTGGQPYISKPGPVAVSNTVAYAPVVFYFKRPK